MSARGGQPHIPPYDLQLHQVHVQVIYWFLESIALTMYLISSTVVQGPWYLYVYTITLFWECYMRHGQCLLGVENPIDLQYDLQLHKRRSQVVHWCLNPIAQTMHLISSIVVKGPWYLYVYTIPPFWECYMRHGQCQRGVENPIDHSITSNYTKDTIRGMLYWADFLNKSPKPCSSAVA